MDVILFPTLVLESVKKTMTELCFILSMILRFVFCGPTVDTRLGGLHVSCMVIELNSIQLGQSHAAGETNTRPACFPVSADKIVRSEISQNVFSC
jgi:hypothetical protein